MTGQDDIFKEDGIREKAITARYEYSDRWNFWTVLCLRRSWHFRVLPIVAGILLLLQLLMLFKPSHTGFTVLLLTVGLGSVFCVAGSFTANHPFSFSKRGPLSHLAELIPLKTERIVIGLVISYAFFFGLFLLCTLPSWAGANLNRDWSPLLQLGRVPEAFLLPLTFFLFINPGRPRAESLLLAWCYALVLFSPRGILDPFWFAPVGAALLLLYAALLYHQSLLPPSYDGTLAMRLGQLVILVAAWALTGIDFSPFRHYRDTELPSAAILLLLVAVLVGAAGTVLDSADPRERLRLRRCCRGTPKCGVLRFFCSGASSGGWFWCYAVAAALSLLSWNFGHAVLELAAPAVIVAAELAAVALSLPVLPLRGAPFRRCDLFFFIALALLLFGYALWRSCPFGNASGEPPSLVRAAWIAAGLLFLPQLPRFFADLRCFLLSGKETL